MADSSRAARVTRNAQALGATAVTCHRCGEPTLTMLANAERYVCSACREQQGF
jgi:formylmethanofuran dehydrogenase subunit E